jgi:hypothetical protein
VTRRTTAILVAVAVVAGATIAGVGLATESSSKPAGVLQIDEQRGRVGQVVLGETAADVVSVLGRPARRLNTPPTDPLVSYSTLVYDHLLVGLRNDHVISIRTDDPAAVTLQAVRIGNPLSAARASYRKEATCNPNSPDKSAAHPYCRVRVASGQLLITGDPIGSITLLRTR